MREKRAYKLHELCKFLCCPMDPQIYFISLYYSQLGLGWRNKPPSSIQERDISGGRSCLISLAMTHVILIP